MAYVMSSAELCAKAEDLVYNHKTLYIMGCFGAPMIPKNKIRYTNNNKYNMTPDRRAMIENASEDTFGFDCVGMVKALCGDWCADTHRTYGGTEVYKVGNRLFYGHDKLVPDADAKGMLNYCVDVSRKWDEVVPGEFLWVDGHCGLYMGNGLACECTPKWDNKVQITAVANLGTVTGYNSRKWTKHGRLQFIDYRGIKPEPIQYVVQRGDNLTKIAKKFNTTVGRLAEVNHLADPNKIYVGQVLTIV